MRVITTVPSLVPSTSAPLVTVTSTTFSQTTMMLRAASLRPLGFSSIPIRSSHNLRFFTTSRSNLLQTVQKGSSKSTSWTQGLFTRASRSFSTESTVIRPPQPISWQRLALTAGGVAVSVVAIEAVLNRETRDGLSLAEQTHLHESFKYTGGGLALTALAARTMFKNGVAYRIMAANPCEYSL